LGEWLGQCKFDKEGIARKVRGLQSKNIVNPAMQIVLVSG
jgi:hypothetical protein